jgi:tRNA-specific 2-thiouridylase
MTAEASFRFEDHLTAPRGRGALADAAHVGAAGGAACGDLVRVAVRVEGDRVAAAGFEASGCLAVQAAGSAVVELVEGRSILDVAKVSAGEVASELGGLSPARRHASELAADALHRSLGAAARDGAPSLAPSPGRTLVAMSGGVDSAVAAHLALEAGHEVIAVTLELFSDPATDGTKSCCSPQAVTGARALAHGLGLPHVTLDLRAPFGRSVVDDFVAEHVAGRTPNPCVRCNGLVRFDSMLRLADALGAARLATGHYARIADDGAGPLLVAAADPSKDQSYMLARLAPEELARLWFPLGEFDKPAVRELARAAALPVAEKPESQDLCFLAGTGRGAFLRRHGADRDASLGAQRPGPIVNRAGAVLGRHGGHERFTVGQRRGLGVGSGEPLYVLSKDPVANRVVVGTRAELATTRVEVRAAHLHRSTAAVDRVKLRYRSEPVPCRVEEPVVAGAYDRLTLLLNRPVDGAAPGQTACLMHGEAVVGAAVIVGAGDDRDGEGEARGVTAASERESAHVG